jgi:hypothetical protein
MVHTPLVCVQSGFMLSEGEWGMRLHCLVWIQEGASSGHQEPSVRVAQVGWVVLLFR